MNTGAGRKLGRPTGPRFQMLRNMAASLLHYEKIETTYPKAREVARFTEKLISSAKAGPMECSASPGGASKSSTEFGSPSRILPCRPAEKQCAAA